MAEIIELTEKHRWKLKEYEGILKKVCFNAYKSTFLDYCTTKELATIYKEITGVEADCKGCADKSFIKRLSFWYCGNRDGILPENEISVKKPGRKPVSKNSKKPKQLEDE